MPAYKSENKGWYFITRYKNSQGIIKQKKQRGFTTKNDALIAEYEFLHDIEQQLKPHYNMTVSQLIPMYLSEKQYLVKPSTFKKYSHILNGIVKSFFGDMIVRDIKNADIIAFHQSLFYPSPNSNHRSVKFISVKSIHIVFVSMIKYAEKHFDIPAISYRFTMPKRHLLGMEHQEPPNSQKFNFYTLNQFEQFINEISDEHKFERDIIEVLYFTGMRVNELLALTHEHIDLEAKKIYVRFHHNFKSQRLLP